MTVGNPLIARQYASDDTINTGSNTVGQGTVFVLVPGGLPAGTLTNFQTFVQNAPVSGLPSPGNTFNAYVLHPTGNLNEYSIVFDSGPQLVPSMSDGVATFPVSGSPAVAAGDLLAFYGQGIPLDVVGSDLVAYPVATAPTGTVHDGLPSADRLGGHTRSARPSSCPPARPPALVRPLKRQSAPPAPSPT